MKELVRIQKGYILIENTREKIKVLYENEEVAQERQKLEEMKKKEEQISQINNNLKDRIMEQKQLMQNKEEEINEVIGLLYKTHNAKEIKKLREKKEHLEEEKEDFRKEISRLFAQVDVVKDEINNHRIAYNNQGKILKKMITIQNEKIVTYEDRISQMEKKIRRIRKAIDSGILEIYDKKRQKDVIVLSMIDQGICSYCGIELGDDIIEEVESSPITSCPKCGRILYLEKQANEEGNLLGDKEEKYLEEQQRIKEKEEEQKLKEEEKEEQEAKTSQKKKEAAKTTKTQKKKQEVDEEEMEDFFLQEDEKDLEDFNDLDEFENYLKEDFNEDDEI